ncbi:alcohol dehydrogenase catalytic domain-containing protein [Paraburkholderia bengalensis]|uniref:Alcohol dehydrogenase catalytic domain-containing protein n=1 Tax=Paraburkholderia bengalensis TaxID=2747562 RepID=A0ABU8IQV8_9BURK
MNSYQITRFAEPLEKRSYPLPQLQGREVLVKVQACGVCHSDLHLWSGFYDLGGGNRISLIDRGATLPFTMGHEVAGEIVAVGPEADASTVGRTGVVFPWIGCGQCDACRRGTELMCEVPRTIGTRKNGGYSDHVVVPDAEYVVDYGALDPKVAAIAACSGLTAYSAIRKLPDLTADDHVLVIGAGGVGLAAVSLLSNLTQANIVVADLSEAKREGAMKAGAGATVSNEDEARCIEDVRRICGGAPRAVMDFVGTQGTGQLALSLLGRGGHMIVVGLFGGEISVSISMLAMRNITIQGSNVGTLQELKALVALLQDGKVDPVPITSRPIEEVNSVLVELAEGRAAGRIVLTP